MKVGEYELEDAAAEIRESRQSLESTKILASRLRGIVDRRGGALHLLRGVHHIILCLPVEAIVVSHPMIAALSTILRHPCLPQDAAYPMDRAHAARVSASLALRQREWNPVHLKLSLLDFMKRLGSTIEVNRRSSMVDQHFSDHLMQCTWDLFFDLAHLQRLGLV